MAVAAPTVSPAPKPLAPSSLDGLKNLDPGLFRTLKAIVDKFNATLNWQTAINDLQAMPKGPRSVTASQLGGTIQINFGSDLGPSPISAYLVYRAGAGTRGAPTTPVVSAAQIVATVPAQSSACLIGTGYAAGTYTWIDRNFTVAELDPSNPSRFQYWVSSVDNQGRVSLPVPA